MQKEKKYIQDRFRIETGLLVDVVLQGAIYYKYIQF
jgi:sulfite reductase alpha subunit-like flavoprotein